MQVEEQAEAGGPEQEPAPAVVAPRNIAIIDDGLVPFRLEEFDPDLQKAITAAVADGPAVKELKDVGYTGTSVEDVLEFVSAPQAPPTVLKGDLQSLAEGLSSRIDDRHLVLRLVELITDHAGAAPLLCNPFEALPDLSGHDLVLIDYFLEGSRGTGDLAKQLAKQVRDQHGGAADQQVVLMSSVEQVREHRLEFRTEADLAGSSFAFVAKPDMDQRWKVKANFGMLDRARPHAPVLAGYGQELAQSLKDASAGLLKIANDLDIGDYAFLQSQALMSDGHPLGDYVSWLLSSQLTTLAFETDGLRKRQWEMDRLQFQKEAFASTEPSEVVAELFHSALLARNLGALGPHPRAAVDGPYSNFPLVQLGDLFLDSSAEKAVVVLSADCDLAFAPTADRPPVGETPVILVPGIARSLDIKKDPQIPAVTEGIVHGGKVYRIDWTFADYRSVELGNLESWLKARGYETGNRSRLRPLYALKLQQEFGAHLFRVGPPIMPPLTFAAEGRIFKCLNKERSEFETFLDGEVMLSHFKDSVTARLTPKLVDSLRRALIDVHQDAQQTVDGIGDERTKANEQRKVDALQAKLDDDDYWISLVNGVELAALGALADRGGVCKFVRGTDWEPPAKPTVVMQISEKVAAAEVTNEAA